MQTLKIFLLVTLSMLSLASFANPVRPTSSVAFLYNAQKNSWTHQSSKIPLPFLHYIITAGHYAWAVQGEDYGHQIDYSALVSFYNGKQWQKPQAAGDIAHFTRTSKQIYPAYPHSGQTAQAWAIPSVNNSDTPHIAFFDGKKWHVDLSESCHYNGFTCKFRVADGVLWEIFLNNQHGFNYRFAIAPNPNAKNQTLPKWSPLYSFAIPNAATSFVAAKNANATPVLYVVYGHHINEITLSKSGSKAIPNRKTILTIPTSIPEIERLIVMGNELISDSNFYFLKKRFQNKTASSHYYISRNYGQTWTAAPTSNLFTNHYLQTRGFSKNIICLSMRNSIVRFFYHFACLKLNTSHPFWHFIVNYKNHKNAVPLTAVTSKGLWIINFRSSLWPLYIKKAYFYSFAQDKTIDTHLENLISLTNNSISQPLNIRIIANTPVLCGQDKSGNYSGYAYNYQQQKWLKWVFPMPLSNPVKHSFCYMSGPIIQKPFYNFSFGIKSTNKFVWSFLTSFVRIG